MVVYYDSHQPVKGSSFELSEKHGEVYITYESYEDVDMDRTEERTQKVIKVCPGASCPVVVKKGSGDTCIPVPENIEQEVIERLNEN